MTPLRSVLVPTLSVLAMLAVGSCGGENAPYARAAQMERLEDGVGGPKAMARPGDFVMENDHIKVAILSARNSLGPGLYGGSLVDADIQRPGASTSKGQGNDQFAELFPTVSMNVTFTSIDDPDAVQIVSDGSDGSAAVVRVSGIAAPFLTLLDALWALVGQPDIHMVTDYIVEPGVPWMTLRTTGTFWAEGDGTPGQPTDYYDDGMPLLDMAIETGAVFGEFYLSGGSVDVFAPGIGFDEDGAVFESMSKGENTFTEPFQFPFLAGIGEGVSYGIAPVEGDLYVPLFTSSQTVAAGGGKMGTNADQRFDTAEAYTYERYFYVGHGDVGSIVDQYLESRAIPYGTVEGTVVEDGSYTPLSGISVFAMPAGDAAPYTQWETDISPWDAVADGSFSGRLPVGEWDLVVHEQGRPEAQVLRVTIAEGDTVQVVLSAPRTGMLQYTVRDERGMEVPAKLTLFRLDGAPRRNPVLGDGFIGGDPETVIFSLYGTGEVHLAPGRYQAVASRGLEYELDISDPFTVDEQTRAAIDLTVLRTVDTPGWISADLHVHGAASHDSGVGLAYRVNTMVSEGVEFFASTDHDHVTDYAPTIELLGLEEWVQSAVGNEVTTVEVGHFLSFPLQHDFLLDRGAGAERLDWTDRVPRELVASMRELGADAGTDPLVFVGHPRDGILGYFDQYGFDPYAGSPGRGGQPGQAAIVTPTLSFTNPLLNRLNITWDFDALELFNGKRMDYLRTPTQTEMNAWAAGTGGDITEWINRTMDEQEGLRSGVYTLGYGHDGVIDDWFALLNLGFKYTALGNSDTHGTTSVEAGCPRNYVMSDTDNPAFIDDQAIADAIKDHRVVASYGPFIEMWVDGEPIGSEFQPADGDVTLQFEVSAPSWIDVSRVELYQNADLIAEWEVEATSDILRIAETVELTVDQDSWFVLIAIGNEDLAPLYTPVEMPPIELQTVVTEALSGVEAVSSLLGPATPVPQVFPVRPYALTNPIWLDLAGDGFDAPGHPSWFVAPTEPEETTTTTGGTTTTTGGTTTGTGTGTGGTGTTTGTTTGGTGSTSP